MSDEWVTALLNAVADAIGTDTFVVKAVVAILLVCLLCGTVGSLAVGNRMAFFSDTMAHCAFAGVTLGLIQQNRDALQTLGEWEIASDEQGRFRTGVNPPGRLRADDHLSARRNRGLHDFPGSTCWGVWPGLRRHQR